MHIWGKEILNSNKVFQMWFWIRHKGLFAISIFNHVSEYIWLKEKQCFPLIAIKLEIESILEIAP